MHFTRLLKKISNPGFRGNPGAHSFCVTALVTLVISVPLSTAQTFLSKWERIAPLANEMVHSNLIDQFRIKEDIVAVLLEEDPDYPRVFVDSAHPDPGDGSSWQTAFQDLQAAIDFVSGSPGEGWIWVKAGVYSPFASANSSVILKTGVILLGGFAGTESSLSGRDPCLNETTIAGYADERSGMRAVDMQHRTMIDGFTITGSGYQKAADGSWGGFSLPESAGGGIRTMDWFSVIRQCLVTGNHARTGGGIAIWNREFKSGESLPGYSPIIEKCIIYDNHSICGAGILVRNSEAFLCHNIIVNNTHQPLENEDDHSKGIEVYLDMERSEPPVVANSILWNNTGRGGFPDLYNHVRNLPGKKAESHYNCMQKGGYGAGLVTDDPLLENPESGDFSISEESPCIDAGCPEGPPDPDSSRADIGIPGNRRSPAEEPDTTTVQEPDTADTQDPGDTPVHSRHPETHVVLRNFPNPFNHSTCIVLTLPEPGRIRLGVYDVTGRHIETLISRFLPAGSRTMVWSAGPLPGAVYILRLEMERQVFHRKMALIR